MAAHPEDKGLVWVELKGLNIWFMKSKWNIFNRFYNPYPEAQMSKLTTVEDI